MRWKIWGNKSVECWYRQNLFTARKNAQEAGQEARIAAVLHPEVSELIMRTGAVERIEDGRLSLGWYAKVPFLGLKSKLMRRIYYNTGPER